MGGISTKCSSTSCNCHSNNFALSLKTIGALIFGIISLAGVWFTLKADIEEAKQLPAPVIERTEYDLKDQLIRETIISTEETRKKS